MTKEGMDITIDQIKDLREKTGAGVADAKIALEESGGDFSGALRKLRERGLKLSQARADRTAGEGWIGSYVHQTGKVGVLVEVRCETDFVSRSAAFQALVRDLALHIAAINPLYLTKEEVPEGVVAQEQDIAREQLRTQGKPEAMWENIIAGKVEKWYTDVCLLSQPFVKDETKTISDLLNEARTALGEKIEITRFVRFQI